jgi:16S rRNA processing protein RimM
LADGRTLEIIEGRPVKDDMLVVRFAGLADREAVRSLTGQNLIVDRANLPETEDEDEFYHADLIGLRAEDAAGTVHGTIVEIHNHGAGDLLLIALNGTRATALLPFTREAVPKVDMKARCILIEPGFLAGPEQPPAEPAPSSPHDP